MMNNKIIAIVLMVVGAGVLYWGYSMSESVGSQLSQSVTGSVSDKIMWHYIGGAASLAVGLYMFFKKLCNLFNESFPNSIN